MRTNARRQWEFRKQRRVATDPEESLTRRKDGWYLTTRSIIQVVAELTATRPWTDVVELLDSPLLPNHRDLVLLPFLQQAAVGADVDLRRAVVQHFAVTPSILGLLSRDRDARIRVAAGRRILEVV